mgnify:CR=1 FL=1
MSVSHALRALNVNGFILRGEPNSEAEFKNMFTKITGSDEDGNAIESSDPNDFGVTWSQVSEKNKELVADEPMNRLRQARNLKLLDTDWWASSDLTMTQKQKDYRQALRDITKSYTSLDDVVWPSVPTE